MEPVLLPPLAPLLIVNCMLVLLEDVEIIATLCIIGGRALCNVKNIALLTVYVTAGINNREMGRMEVVRNVVRTGLKTNMTLLTVDLNVHVAPSNELPLAWLSIHA